MQYSIGLRDRSDGQPYVYSQSGLHVFQLEVDESEVRPRLWVLVPAVFHTLDDVGGTGGNLF